MLPGCAGGAAPPARAGRTNARRVPPTKDSNHVARLCRKAAPPPPVHPNFALTTPPASTAGRISGFSSFDWAPKGRLLPDLAILDRVNKDGAEDLREILPRWKPWLPPKNDQGLQQGGAFVFRGRQGAH